MHHLSRKSEKLGGVSYKDYPQKVAIRSFLFVNFFVFVNALPVLAKRFFYDTSKGYTTYLC